MIPCSAKYYICIYHCFYHWSSPLAINNASPIRYIWLSCTFFPSCLAPKENGINFCSGGWFVTSLQCEIYSIHNSNERHNPSFGVYSVLKKELCLIDKPEWCVKVYLQRILLVKVHQLQQDYIYKTQFTSHHYRVIKKVASHVLEWIWKHFLLLYLNYLFFLTSLLSYIIYNNRVKCTCVCTLRNIVQ